VRVAVVLTAALASCCLAQAPTFVECAGPIGCAHTFAPAPGYPGTHDQMAGGLTVGDFNADGWPDIFALGGGLQPDRLFINRQDGSFADEAPSWGLGDLHRGVSASAGDVNGDGRVDLYLVSYGPAGQPASNAANRLLLNRLGPEGPFFEDAALVAGVRTFATGPDGMGSVLGDIDSDGDLDLFVCSWFANTEGNRLFINQGNDADGVPRFVDATPSMDVDLIGTRGYTPRMVDLSGDRLPDLLLTADFGTSRLLINEGPGPDGLPRFRDETLAAGITEDQNGMGAAIGDPDNDGDLDWFMTNIYYQFANATNTLYLNAGLDEKTGAPVFLEEATAAGVFNNGWGWGAVFGDFDNDGDEDLAATGGWFQYPGVPAKLWRNNGTVLGVPRFTDVASSAGVQFQGLGRTLVTLDFDRDGDLDLAMSAKDSALRIWRNQTGEAAGDANHWVQFTLDASAHPCLVPDGRHAIIEVEADGVTHTRLLDGGPTYLGNPELLAHVGLGAATVIDHARVRWADGSFTDLGSPAIDTRHLVRAFHPADLTRDGVFDLTDLQAFVQAFLSGDPAADFTGDGVLDLADLVPFTHALTGSPCN
jgi:hypothetical protein